MNDFLSADYWQERYQVEQTGWDVGYATPAFEYILSKYIDRKKQLQILIPGAGNAYEAELALEMGFEDVTIMDWAKQPLENFKNRNPNFPPHKLLQQDFFLHNQQYDLILEQTFFCALNPEKRLEYARKMKSLLKQNGSLEGVLFNVEMPDGPPYGGSINEYKEVFSEQFSSVKIEPTELSIEPRKGREVLIEVRH